MDHLPSAEDQQWLLDRLSALTRRDYRTFVTAPIVEPVDAFFPDRWEPTLAGAEVLIRRLCHYADLPGDRLLVAARQVGDIDEDIPVLFQGMDGDAFFFTVDQTRLADAEGVVAEAAREVASAYRCRHSLLDPDPQTESRLTDVVTIYLGFGVLTTRHAHRYVSWSEPSSRAKSGFVRVGHHAVGGALSPQAMSFLLAAQSLARGDDRFPLGRLEDYLPANQWAFFETARELFSADEVRNRLRLPSPATWPQVRSLLVAPPPMEPSDFEESGEVAAADPRRGFNAGRNVFRVVGTEGGKVAFAGFVLGLGAGFALRLWMPSPGVVILGAMVGCLGGWAFGRLSTFSFCSDPQCEESIKSDAMTCPRCGGTVRGEIKSASDRLAAEEALEDAAKGRRGR